MPIPLSGHGSLSVPVSPMAAAGRALGRPGVEGLETAVELDETSHRRLEEAPEGFSGPPWCCDVAVEGK